MINKLMFFPLGLMFLITAYSIIASGETYEGETDDWSESGEMTINGTIGDDTGYAIIPEADPLNINLWFAGAALILLTAAVAVGVASGFSILGSGLTTFSQKLLFNVILYLGLWAALTVVSSTFFFDTPLLTLSWMGITTMYVAGVGLQMTSSGE